MKKIIIGIIIVIIILIMTVSCENSHKIKYPYTQEYVPGNEGIQGNVDKEFFENIDEDFAIGANKDGYAVFKEPHAAFEKLYEKYHEGIKLIESEFNLDPLIHDNHHLYLIYGGQVTTGDEQAKEEALFVSKFLDIYENSFKRD